MLLSIQLFKFIVNEIKLLREENIAPKLLKFDIRDIDDGLLIPMRSVVIIGKPRVVHNAPFLPDVKSKCSLVENISAKESRFFVVVVPVVTVTVRLSVKLRIVGKIDLELFADFREFNILYLKLGQLHRRRRQLSPRSCENLRENKLVVLI